MAKRAEVDWAEEIVEGMKKPLPRSAGDWNAVKITCVDEKIVAGNASFIFPGRPPGPRCVRTLNTRPGCWKGRKRRATRQRRMACLPDRRSGE